MSLNWNVSDIENFEEECFTDWEDGSGQLDPVTNQLIWVTIPIGISKITAENYKIFHSRLYMYEELFGYFVSYCDEENGTRYRAIDEETVKKHIGLWTNASDLSRQEFIQNVLSRWERTVHKLTVN